VNKKNKRASTFLAIVDGKIDVKGVVPPELCIDPLRNFKELNLRDREIEIYESCESYKPLFKL